MKNLVIILSKLAMLTVLFSACSPNETIKIHPIPNDASLSSGPRWSPKGEKLQLEQKGDILVGSINLGNEDKNGWNIALTKSQDSEYYNILSIDHNKNGEFERPEQIHTTPSESRGKIWSSFNAIINIQTTDPWNNTETEIPYALSFWYVFDPSGQANEEVIRFSRKGWYEVNFKLDSIDATIMITEGLMDGKIDTNDYWALAPVNDRKLLFESNNCYAISHHAWINEKAYKIVNVDESGLMVELEAYDPGMSLKEEKIMEDPYYEDKIAKRSGNQVVFMHDYEQALQKAKEENKMLLIDFETSWCGPCKQMDRLVYNADLVVEASQGIVAVKIDGDKNPELVKKYEVDSYPTLIMTNFEEKALKRVSGYQSVKMLVDFLK
jgi:thiol-disulfide isomerase/thioredoxin